MMLCRTTVPESYIRRQATASSPIIAVSYIRRGVKSAYSYRSWLNRCKAVPCLRPAVIDYIMYICRLYPAEMIITPHSATPLAPRAPNPPHSPTPRLNQITSAAKTRMRTDGWHTKHHTAHADLPDYGFSVAASTTSLGSRVIDVRHGKTSSYKE